jgi:hypothetical protein
MSDAATAPCDQLAQYVWVRAQTDESSAKLLNDFLHHQAIERKPLPARRKTLAKIHRVVCGQMARWVKSFSAEIRLRQQLDAAKRNAQAYMAAKPIPETPELKEDISSFLSVYHSS